MTNSLIGNHSNFEPCPFCGSTVTPRRDGFRFVVCCDNPDCADVVFNTSNLERVKELWRSRYKSSKATHAPIEEHPNHEAFIRAFWRRIEPYKNDYNKELPKELPVEFKAHMATAGLLLQEPLEGLPEEPRDELGTVVFIDGRRIFSHVTFGSRVKECSYRELESKVSGMSVRIKTELHDVSDLMYVLAREHGSQDELISAIQKALTGEAEYLPNVQNRN